MAHSYSYATTSNAAMRKKMPFHVSIMMSQGTSSLSDFFRKCDGGDFGCSSRRESNALAGLMRGRATRKCAKIAPFLRVAAKKTRLLRCSSLHMNNYYAPRRKSSWGTPSSRLASIVFWLATHFVKEVRQAASKGVIGNIPFVMIGISKNMPITFTGIR